MAPAACFARNRARDRRLEFRLEAVIGRRKKGTEIDWPHLRCASWRRESTDIRSLRHGVSENSVYRLTLALWHGGVKRARGSAGRGAECGAADRRNRGIRGPGRFPDAGKSSPSGLAGLRA